MDVATKEVVTTDVADQESEQAGVLGSEETSLCRKKGQIGTYESETGGEITRNTRGVEKAEDNVSGRKKWRRGENVTRWVHWRARNDMVRMTVKGTVNQMKKVRKVFDDESIERTLKYILSDMNVQLMSWGTTRIKVNGKKMRFPHLVKKVGIEVMWRNYGRDSQFFSDKTKKVGRTENFIL